MRVNGFSVSFKILTFCYEILFSLKDLNGDPENAYRKPPTTLKTAYTRFHRFQIKTNAKILISRTAQKVDLLQNIKIWIWLYVPVVKGPAYQKHRFTTQTM